MEKEDKFYPEEKTKGKSKPSEEIGDEMEKEEKDKDIYTKEGREKLVEDAEISAEEEGFMRGEEEARKPNEEQE